VAVSELFSAEQLSRLYLIRDHIAKAISVELENLELMPFQSAQRLEQNTSTHR